MDANGRETALLVAETETETGKTGRRRRMTAFPAITAVRFELRSKHSVPGHRRARGGVAPQAVRRAHGRALRTEEEASPAEPPTHEG